MLSLASTSSLSWVYDKYSYLTALKVVFGAAIVAANCLTLYGLARARGVKTTLRLGLINLAVTDLMAGLVFSYHSLAARYIPRHTVECEVRYAILVLAITATLCTLFMMSLDRVAALYSPYRYDTIMATKNVYAWIAGNWCVALVFALASIHGNDLTSSECNFIANGSLARLWTYAMAGLISIAGILLLQVVIFTAAIRQVRKILPTIPGGRNEPVVLQGLRLHMKATVTTGIVVVPFFLLTLPLYAFFLFLAIHPEERFKPDNLYFVDGGLFLQSLNSLVNPGIYIWRLTAVREPIKRALCQRCSSESPTSSPPTSITRWVSGGRIGGS